MCIEQCSTLQHESEVMHKALHGNTRHCEGMESKEGKCFGRTCKSAAGNSKVFHS